MSVSDVSRELVFPIDIDNEDTDVGKIFLMEDRSEFDRIFIEIFGGYLEIIIMAPFDEMFGLEGNDVNCVFVGFCILVF